MKKIKNTKRALIMSALALLVCVSMLVGSTFAWFTDSATSGSNVIQSGTLKVDLEDEAGNSLVGQSIPFVKATGHESEAILWEPGCTYELTPVYVHNEGNLALKYKIDIKGLDGDAKLLEAIEWSVKVNDTVTDLDGFEEVLNADAKSDNAVVLVGHMKEEAGNEYQGLTADGISITVCATQATVEYDSFDNQYDANAEYPTVVSTADELATALADGGEVVLSADIALNDAPLTVKGDAIIDTNGHTLSGVATNASTSAMITVKSGATLTLTGDGVISFGATTPDTNWGGVGQPAFPGYASNTIRCEGELVVDGVTIENVTAPGGASYAIDCYQGSNLIVNSGVIDGVGKCAIRMFCNSNTLSTNVTINGGTITGKRAIWVHLPGSKITNVRPVNLTINGGTLICTNTTDDVCVYAYSYGDSFANTNITITGGDFTGDMLLGYNGGNTGVTVPNITVTGGTFSGDVGYYEGDTWKDI